VNGCFWDFFLPLSGGNRLKIQIMIQFFQKYKGLITTVGFLFFILGASGVVLSLVSVRLAILVWMDAFGGLLGFILKLVMMIAGIVLAVLANTNWVAEDEEKDEYIRRNERY
jgi:hypothetical protein